MEVFIGEYYETYNGEVCIVEAMTSLGVKILLINTNSVKIINRDNFLNNWKLVKKEVISTSDPFIAIPDDDTDIYC